MGPSHARIATTFVVVMLVAACGTAPSPSPNATSSSPTPTAPPPTQAPPTVMPSASPTPQSTAGTTDWPYELDDAVTTVGPNGTAYLLVQENGGGPIRKVVALDTAGRVKPGWSIDARQGSSFLSLVVGSDGSVYVDECGARAVGCAVHRLGQDGRDLPGWPFEIPADFACPASDGCNVSALEIGSNGFAYIVRGHTAELGLMAVDSDGDIVPGWPLILGEHEWTDTQLGPDGTLFVVRRPFGTPTHDPSLGVIDKHAQLWAFSVNGKSRPGWPVPVPNLNRYLVGPRGDVVVWSLLNDVGELCSNPRRTLFTVLSPDGRTSSGWPRGSTGFASFPTVGPDGTLYYVSATNRLYAHDTSGEVITGWPVEVPGAGDACGPQSPYVAPDGTIYVVGDEVTAVSRDGRPLPGWPYRPAAGMIGPCFDTECYGGHAPPVVAPDGTVYLMVYPSDPSGVRAEVLALDRRGELKPGWPYRLPFDANKVGVGFVGLSADGRLFVRGGDQLLALDPEGRLSR